MKKSILLTLAAFLAAVISARALEVKEFWEKNCAKCHGPEGKGDTKMGKKLDIVNLTDPKVQEKFNDEQMAKSIKEGVNDKEGKIRMKPAEGVTEAEIKQLVAYVRTLKKA